MTANFLTDWCSPPGATIRDALSARNIDLDTFARTIGQSRNHVDLLIKGDMAIDRELAIALADTIGASPKFWLQREQDFQHDRQLLSVKSDDALKAWVNSFPIADMAKFGWVPATKVAADRLRNCLDFFGISSVSEWEERYGNQLSAVAFRSSATFETDVPATLAWIRQGERMAEQLETAVWNKNKFKAALPNMKALTRERSPQVFLPELKRLAAECGVAIVVARTPKGCRASGATKFLGPKKALMMLSFRHRSDDHFWFTVFHEAAHLLLHDASMMFIENGDCVMEVEEAEANAFSQELLVPKRFHDELRNIRRDYRLVARFAQRIGVSAGIVVGQMQHHGLIPATHFNALKRRFDWDQITAASTL